MGVTTEKQTNLDLFFGSFNLTADKACVDAACEEG